MVRLARPAKGTGEGGGDARDAAGPDSASAQAESVAPVVRTSSTSRGVAPGSARRRDPRGTASRSAAPAPDLARTVEPARQAASGRSRGAPARRRSGSAGSKPRRAPASGRRGRDTVRSAARAAQAAAIGTGGSRAAAGRRTSAPSEAAGDPVIGRGPRDRPRPASTGAARAAGERLRPARGATGLRLGRRPADAQRGGAKSETAEETSRHRTYRASRAARHRWRAAVTTRAPAPRAA